MQLVPNEEAARLVGVGALWSMSGIDAHTHLSNGHFDPAIFASGDRLGIGTYLCSNLGLYQEDPTPDEIQDMNRVMASEVRKHPERLRAYCYVNPRHGEAALTDLRRNVEERSMIGVKLWIATTADDSAAEPILRYAAQHRLIVLAHAWRKTAREFAHESTASNIAVAARRHPDVRFIMAHMGGQPESAIAVVEDLPNVAVDTSGTIVSAGEVALTTHRLGAARVVFGSDAPLVCLSGAVGKVLAAALNSVDEEAIFGGTIARWLAEVAT